MNEPTLRWSGDIGQAAWIADSLTEEQFVPAGFGAYAEVLHPVETSRTGTRLVRWRDVAEWSGLPLKPGAWFESIGIPPVPVDGERPWSSQGPDKGELYMPDARVLGSILRRFTTTPESCWFCLWDGHHVINIAAREEGGTSANEDIVPKVALNGPRVALTFGRRYHLFHGPVEGFDRAPFGERFGFSPNLCWPTDRAWIVITEIYFPWTYVGGTEELLSEVVADNRIEAMGADPFAAMARVPWIAAAAEDAANELFIAGTAVLAIGQGKIEATLQRFKGGKTGWLQLNARGTRVSGASRVDLSASDEEGLIKEIGNFLYTAITDLS
jgi:hypothetical protein